MEEQQTETFEKEKKIISSLKKPFQRGLKVPYFNKRIVKFQKEQIKKDGFRTNELINKGYRVIRLLEHDIKKIKLNEIQEKLIR